jgi:AhpC/TSA family protein
MAPSEDDKLERWVADQLSELTPDRRWNPDVQRGLQRLHFVERHPRRWVLWMVAMAAACLFVVSSTTVRAFARTCGVFIARVTGLSPSRPRVQNLVLAGNDGRMTTLSAFRGRVVVLTVWPDACSTCQTERSWFQEFEGDYRERGLAVVGTALEQSGPAVGASVPTTLILDRDGRLAVRHVGFCSKAEYRRDIEKLLAE